MEGHWLPSGGWDSGTLEHVEQQGPVVVSQYSFHFRNDKMAHT
jgi:hypothetical protein